MLQKRVEKGLDESLQRTQYGFRKNRSTGDAIQCIRSLIDYAEQTGECTILLLLDWEKAFDKVRHEALFFTLKRLNVPGNIQRAIENIYNDIEFMVRTDGDTSK